jgi:predicted HicB family RNase H-like nuclease
MTHRGYAARIEYSAEDDGFIGRIAGIADIVTFHGDSVATLRASFEAAVDDYLATCERIGKRPQRAYSGQIMVRVPPELHARAAMAADARGESLTAFVAHALERAAG